MSETAEVIIVQLGTVTASSATRIHHVSIISTLTFLQGHTDLNRESNTCSISLETVQFQAMPIKFVMKVIRPKVYIIFFSVRWPWPSLKEGMLRKDVRTKKEEGGGCFHWSSKQLNSIWGDVTGAISLRGAVSLSLPVLVVCVHGVAGVRDCWKMAPRSLEKKRQKEKSVHI